MAARRTAPSYRSRNQPDTADFENKGEDRHMEKLEKTSSICSEGLFRFSSICSEGLLRLLNALNY